MIANDVGRCWDWNDARYFILILSEDTILNKRMTYCNRLAIIFARGWPLSCLIDESGIVPLGENGRQSLFERITGKGETKGGKCRWIRWDEMATGMSFQTWHEISLPSFHLFLKCYSLCSFISFLNEIWIGMAFACTHSKINQYSPIDILECFP